MFLTFIVVLFLISLIPVVTRQKKQFIWFPSLGALLRALGLAIPTWVGFVIFPSVLGWQFLLMLIFAVATQAPLEIIGTMAVVGFLFLFGSLFWYLLLVGLYSLVLRLFWLEIPQFLRWLEPPKKKRDIFFGWVASTLAVLIAVTPIVTLILLSGHSNDFTVESPRYRESLSQTFAVGTFTIWFIVCAYLYQIRSYINLRHRNRKARSQVT